MDLGTIWPIIYYICVVIYFIWSVFYLTRLAIRRYWKKKGRGVPADVGGEPGFAVRSSEFDSPPVTQLWENVKTIADIVTRKFEDRDHGDRLFLGTREVISREVEIGPDGRSFEKLHLGGYQWLTYRQVHQAVRHFSKGLACLDVEGERVAIFADTRPECFIALHGCFTRKVTVVALCSSLGEEALCRSLNETEVKTVICGRKELEKLVNVRGQLESVKCVICMDDDIPFDVLSALHGWTIISFGDVKKIGGKRTNMLHACRRKEVALIMYTSGSTGLPKAVVMTHANIFATVSSLVTIVPELGEDDVYLAYLPMADILELVVEHIIAAVGGAIGYGSPLTLTDTSINIKKGTKGDATILVPTLMPAVPAILDRVCDGALKKVNAKAGLSKKLFDLAYERRLRAINGSWFAAWGLEKVLWNFLVFRKVRTMLGGRIRYILSSGAPLSAHTHRFINICLSAKIGQGYGLTETCAGGTFFEYDDTTVGRVGSPLPCSYIKLIDWPEGGYSTSDSSMPCGEIVIGGTSVTLGYFKNEEKTRESYKVDERGVRWFYTGDIGRFHADGCLEIIDRKTNIVKLQHGEYVSLGKVEAALIASPFVDNVMLHADPFHSYCVALVVVSHLVLKEWTSMQGIAYFDLAELYSKEAIVKEVYVSLVKEAKKACLEKFEIPTKIKLLSGPWTPEIGLVTTTLKIKRESVREAFQEELSELYAS